MKIPLLISDGEGGGPGMLDHCIVKICDAENGRVLYSHPQYHLPVIEIRPVGNETCHHKVGAPLVTLASLGYTHGTWVQNKNGTFENHANFKSLGKAAQWVAFMTGDCMQQPN